jgi:hypothetical protein
MKLITIFIRGVTDDNIWKRIIWMYFSFFLLLVPVTILSHFLLPEGILRGKNPLIGFELSSSLWVSTLQIFGYNLIFTCLMIGANLFARQSRIYPEKFIPTGYLAFWGVTVTAALYLGTWSIEVVTPAPPLLQRFVRLFDIAHRAFGSSLDTCLLPQPHSSSHFGIQMASGK